MQGGLCAGCEWSIRFWEAPADHIVPQKRAGTDHPCNIQMLCPVCNSTKSRRSQLYLMLRLVQFGLVSENEANGKIQPENTTVIGFRG